MLLKSGWLKVTISVIGNLYVSFIGNFKSYASKCPQKLLFYLRENVLSKGTEWFGRGVYQKPAYHCARSYQVITSRLFLSLLCFVPPSLPSHLLFFPPSAVPPPFLFSILVYGSVMSLSHLPSFSSSLFPSLSRPQMANAKEGLIVMALTRRGHLCGSCRLHRRQRGGCWCCTVLPRMDLRVRQIVEHI